MSGPAWSLAGNAGTTPTSNFIGTTDAQDWVMRTNNIERARILSNGNMGVGNSTPTSKLEVDGAATNATSLNAGNSSTINFGLSNLAYSSANAATYTLSNLKDGGAYSLILTSLTNTGSATFSSIGFTFKYMSTIPRTNGKTHIYSFIVAGNVVYVSMATEN